jgi:two-component system, OmpR family, heavy metal sensor histidine kinase CusS
MSSNPAKPHSIAGQLVLLFTLSAALLLSCGLGVFYWMVVRHAFEEDDVVSADKVDTLQQDFEQRGGITSPSFQIDATRGSPFYVRVIDPAGVTIRETLGMNDLPPNVFPFAASREIAAPKEYRSNGRLFALTTRHAVENGDQANVSNGRLFTIQVAQDRSSDEQVAREFRVLALVVLAIGSVAAAALSITVTRRGLRPLARMRRSLERVQPGHLNERIDPSPWPSELRPLAASFDDMLARLEDSFTRLSQFSADLAHELRTPIGNMLGEAQVALTRDRPSKEYRAVIESTATECERLSGIIDSLLFLARAESAEQKIEKQLFDGRAALEKIAAFYQASADDRHIKIACEGNAQIFADPMLFNRAIGNLIENSLRFTPDGGEIRISAATKNGDAQISVADNGSGIGPEHLPRVFDRFYRADPSRSSAGTGLGLSLVKSIVGLHSGSVQIQSTPNVGTTLILGFPNFGSQLSR